MFAKQSLQLTSKTFDFLITRGMQQNVALKAAAATVSHEVTPIQIDVPWGKIEGKLWRSSNDKQPILAVHGWMDNAGSFDMLAPLLKDSSILAIDMPGHGLSSWLPRGIPYNEDLYTLTIRSIVKTLGWKKVKLIGHSMGGVMCNNYTRLFPEETQFLVSIDSISFLATTVAKHSKKRAKAMDNFIDFEKSIKNSKPRSYPEEIAVDKLVKGTHFKSLDIPTAKTLMIRGAERKEDGTYSYNHDSCIKFEGFHSHYDLNRLKDMASLITCPYLVIRATNTSFRDEDVFWDEIIEVLRKNNKDIRYVRVEGNHHLHMINPEAVANEIIPFLERYDV